MKEVFISYHHDSAEKLVEAIASRLESAGFPCFYAGRDVPKGGDFTSEIMRSLNECKVFLLILNSCAVKSRYVQNELTIAFQRQNRGESIDILPFCLEKCALGPMEIHLVTAQFMNAFDRPEERIGDLVKAVAHLLGREPAKNGWCGPDAEWMLKDNALTIWKGTSKSSLNAYIGDFYYQNIPNGYNAPWWSEYKTITDVIIENGITSIGMNAFHACTGLVRVKIPESVTSIRICAFDGCTNLTSVNIPKNVTSIEGWAFYGCTALESIAIPDGVRSIDKYAFYGCVSLTNIDIPASVTKIGEYAFSDCNNLKSVTISDGVTIIGKCAFNGCKSLTNVEIPDSATNIKRGAFSCCTSLTSVSVPANAEIEQAAFNAHTQVIRRKA